MALNNKILRPLLTFGFAAAGAFGGSRFATYYVKVLNTPPQSLTSGQIIGLNVFFVIVGALLGFILERWVFHYISRLHSQFENMDPQDKISFYGGVFLGVVLTALVTSILPKVFTKNVWWSSGLLGVVLCYVCVAALNSLKEQLRFVFPSAATVADANTVAGVKPKLLDTNVIIDGRVTDICKAGFLEGVLYVPKFVLEELQLIADSADSLKRARGRRGLEILNQMQKERDLQVPDLHGADDSRADVDSKLVLAAQAMNAAIVTNDYNLNKVAGLQGIEVLNINELANALKPVVLPGEEMPVTVIKEGKEKEQGIGYLDDGTMIVVEGARRLIGETLDVSVTSVLQTVQGKMIFGKMKEGTSDHSEDTDRNGIRAFAGSRARTKIR